MFNSSVVPLLGNQALRVHSCDKNTSVNNLEAVQVFTVREGSLRTLNTDLSSVMYILN